jgi:hypothetical protein
MASTTTVFNNFLLELAKATITLPNGTNTSFKIALVNWSGSSGTPAPAQFSNKALSVISSVMDGVNVTEVPSGSGYSAGGATPATITVALAGSGNSVEISVADVSWPASTITAKGAIIYQIGTGKLFATVDFGAEVSSANSTLTVDFQGPFRIQN